MQVQTHPAAAPAQALDFSPLYTRGWPVGRHTERDALAGALDRAEGGGRRVLLMEAPAGAGKSRLLDDLLDQADARGLLSLRLDGRSERAAVRLERLLRERLGAAPTALAVDSAERLGAEAMALLARAAERPRLALVIAARAAAALPAALRSLASPLPLPPLSDEQIQDLICRQLGVSSLPEALGERLRAAAAGNPGRAEALILGLRARGVFSVERGCCRLTEGGAGSP
jgi:hypothetical protein